MANITPEYIEDRQEKCPKCGKSPTYLKQVKQHIGWYCFRCGWLKWRSQKWQIFVMPFGKHKGKTLQWIAENDQEYIDWAAHKMENKNIKEKFQEAYMEIFDQ